MKHSTLRHDFFRTVSTIAHRLPATERPTFLYGLTLGAWFAFTTRDLAFMEQLVAHYGSATPHERALPGPGTGGPTR